MTLEQLMLAAALFIQAHSDLNTNHPLPEVKYLPVEEMERLAYGHIFTQGEREVNEVLSLYDNKNKVIILSKEFSTDDVYDQEHVVHELVHHFQAVNDLRYPCPEAREKLAYELGSLWLTSHGGKEWKDPLWVMMATTCPF